MRGPLQLVREGGRGEIRKRTTLPQAETEAEGLEAAAAIPGRANCAQPESISASYRMRREGGGLQPPGDVLSTARERFG